MRILIDKNNERRKYRGAIGAAKISSPWEKDFPKGYGHTSIAYLKRCPGYDEAKYGCLYAARLVVNKCVKDYRILALREKYANAVLLPVMGRNVLPIALAQVIGLPIWEKVYPLHTAQRKTLSAIERLIHKPSFSGYIQEDMAFIIVDDVITQGGTVAALRDYVLSRRGKVVAVAALAFAIGSHDVAPAKRQIARLETKHSRSIYILQAYEIADSFEELTNSQVKYLLMFSSVGNILKKLSRHGFYPADIDKDFYPADVDKDLYAEQTNATQQTP